LPPFSFSSIFRSLLDSFAPGEFEGSALDELSFLFFEIYLFFDLRFVRWFELGFCKIGCIFECEVWILEHLEHEVSNKIDTLLLTPKGPYPMLL
jgi:hypothetical protein